MSRVRVVTAAMAAILVVAGCGSAATPTGSAQPTGVPAGTYSSKAFKPQVTYTLPAGWLSSDDSLNYLDLKPAGSEVAGIFLFRGPLAASQAAGCPDAPQSGIGTSSTALSTWIRALPGLTVSQPKLATVGGLRGVELDISIVAGWKLSCPFANGLAAVPLFAGPGAEYRWVVADNERLRMDILDAPDGSTIVVDIDAFDGTLFDDLVTVAAPIVRSMAFKTS